MSADLLRDDPSRHKSFRYLALLMGSNVLELQKRGPTRKEAIGVFEKIRREARPLDAQDTIHQLEASWDYDPSPKLARVRARVTAINFADDPINPPELGIFERECGRVMNAQCILMPATEDTFGHGNHSRPALWKEHLVRLLAP
jgi:homoserine O-acetyltransferase